MWIRKRAIKRFVTVRNHMQRTRTNNVVLIAPPDDHVFTMTMLCRRWNCTQRVAVQRLQDHEVPIIRFNDRVHGVLLSEILQLEHELSQPVTKVGLKANE
jgi:hypothetical protein